MTTEEPLHVRIDTTHWVRGTLGIRYKDVNDENPTCYCALGFYAKACGVTDDQLGLARIGHPRHPKAEAWSYMGFMQLAQYAPEYFSFEKRRILERIAQVNDGEHVTGRRARLEELFHLLGVTVEFVGDATDPVQCMDWQPAVSGV